MVDVLIDAMRYGVRIAHLEEGWISPFLDAVKAVDSKGASWKPGPDVASIWEITAHAVPYIEGRLCDFTGETYPSDEDWPEVGNSSPEAWAALQARAATAVNRLQEAVDQSKEAELVASAPGKKDVRVARLMDIIVHDAYHAGQIIKLEQTYRAAEIRVGDPVARI